MKIQEIYGHQQLSSEKDCFERKQCDADLPEKEFQVYISYSGILTISAVSEEVAIA